MVSYVKNLVLCLAFLEKSGWSGGPNKKIGLIVQHSLSLKWTGNLSVVGSMERYCCIN